MKKILVIAALIGVIGIGMSAFAVTPCDCQCRYCPTDEYDPVKCKVWEYVDGHCRVVTKWYQNITWARCGCDCVNFQTCKPAA